MKKILVILLLVCCAGAGFAQKGTGKALRNLPKVEEQIARVAAQKYVRPTIGVLESITIPNLPGSPMVKFHLPFVANAEKSTASLLPPDDVFPLVFSRGPRAMFPKRMFVPQGFLSKEKTFYRGMKLILLEDLVNLFQNGLELGKSVDFPKDIYVTSEGSFAVAYAMPGTGHNQLFGVEANLPVLIKIPGTEELRHYAPEVFKYRETFRRNVPARFISDIWVFLKVNDTPGWYKAVVENNELILLSVPGESLPWSAGIDKRKK